MTGTVGWISKRHKCNIRGESDSNSKKTVTEEVEVALDSKYVGHISVCCCYGRTRQKGKTDKSSDRDGAEKTAKNQNKSKMHPKRQKRQERQNRQERQKRQRRKIKKEQNSQKKKLRGKGLSINPFISNFIFHTEK